MAARVLRQAQHERMFYPIQFHGPLSLSLSSRGRPKANAARGRMDWAND
jgi:hypothetical protein